MLASNFNTQSELNKVKKFLNSASELDEFKKDYDECVEIINTNIRWMDVNFNSVNSWLMQTVNKYNKSKQ